MQVKKVSFPNPKLSLPEEFREEHDASKISFEHVDHYLDMVAPFIFTNINLDYQPKSHEQIRAWILRSISESVLRSLYIRNSFVDSINARNLAGAYLALKAWIEIVGFLASILDMLEKKLSNEEMHEKLLPYFLGNKGKGKMRIGEIEAKSVAALIENADKYISKLSPSSTYPNAGEIIDTFFTDYYDVASNPSHPSFDAHEMVGGLKSGEGIWEAFTPERYQQEIFEQRPGYGGLLMSGTFIVDICRKIFDQEEESFKKLGILYFI